LKLTFLRKILNSISTDKSVSTSSNKFVSYGLLFFVILFYAFRSDFSINETQKDINPLEKQKIELGRTLFFDPILSLNGKRSCASCHRPQKAFTDHRIVSKGFVFAENLDKNAPTLINTYDQKSYFHDGRFSRLEDVFEAVITNKKEFNFTYEGILERLNSNADYLNLLKEIDPQKTAFTRADIDENLKNYLKILRGYDSVFDKIKRGELDDKEGVMTAFSTFSEKAKCTNCHAQPNFNQANLTFNIEGKTVKVPSLRNVFLTEPYMYDGRMLNLSSIFEDNFHRDFLVKNKIEISEEEKVQILFFLKNLNDAPQLDVAEPKKLPSAKGFENRRIGGDY
jgi:cytochrome c peroxidase